MSDLESVKKLRSTTGAGFKDCNSALKEASGDLEKANAIILDPSDGAYSLKNKINHLTGKEWTKSPCS